MKKHLFLFVLVSLLAMSFKTDTPVDKISKHSRSNTKSNKPIVKPTCNCGVPQNLTGSSSGGMATLSWDVVPGAVSYSVGGYYSCSPTPPTFNICATSNSVTFAVPCGGTFRVTANCDGGGICTSATCSSSPSGTGTF